MTTTALTTTAKAAPPIEFDSRQLEVLQNTIARECNPGQLRLFLEVVAQTGLNPFDRQIYPVVRAGKMTIQTGIDGYRLQAQRTGEYGGSETEWCDESGAWTDVWLDDTHPPFAAKTTVWRNGAKYVHVAKWSEFAQKFNGQLADMWAKMPSNQLGKCSEAGALRRAFPAELARMFVDAEAGAVEAVWDSEDGRDRGRPRIPEQPKRKAKSAAAIHREQPEQEPFGSEDDAPLDGEVVMPAGEARGEKMAWGDFWNALASRQLGLAVIGPALGIGTGVPALKAWFEENGATGELLDFIEDAVAATRGG